MKNADFTVSVKVDGAIFKDFALFDTFHRQRRWKSPAIFVSIMLLFSLIAFSRVGKAEQAVLLGTVLLCIGLLLPVVYFLNFFLSVHTQVKKLGLNIPRYVYTLQFGKHSGVEISSDKEQVALGWDELFAAYRTNRCIYLYAAPHRAYLLPNEQIENGADELWALIISATPQLQLHDYRNGRHTPLAL
ncbi:MAG: hypothetical protein K0S22_293 [Oscillospiraceae bacterium]|jgi:hypothetical protein|nr:hypothetical protein [Oscillospiraceae bacterium]